MKTAPIRSFKAKSGSEHESSAPAAHGSAAEGDGAAAPGPTTLLTSDICAWHNSLTAGALKALVTQTVPYTVPETHVCTRVIM